MELGHEATIVTLNLLNESPAPSASAILIARAQTEIPGEVRAKYHRGEGRSTVEADVHVTAVDGQRPVLRAVVRVKLVFNGDMVRSSPTTRQRIGDRLHEIASRQCAEVVHRRLQHQEIGSQGE